MCRWSYSKSKPKSSSPDEGETAYPWQHASLLTVTLESWLHVVVGEQIGGLHGFYSQITQYIHLSSLLCLCIKSHANVSRCNLQAEARKTHQLSIGVRIRHHLVRLVMNADVRPVYMWKGTSDRWKHGGEHNNLPVFVCLRDCFVK